MVVLTDSLTRRSGPGEMERNEETARGASRKKGKTYRHAADGETVAVCLITQRQQTVL